VTDALTPLLLSTDFDGTILDHDLPPPMAPEFFDWIEDQRRRRTLVWVINTGRDWESLRNELEIRQARFLPDWVILIEREVHRIEKGSLRSHEPWNQRCLDVHADLFTRADALMETMRRDLAHFPGLQIIRDVGSPLGLIAASEAQAAEVHTALQPLYDAFPDLHAVRNTVYFRFAHVDYHKGSCLALVQAETGIGPEHTIAAGDNLNDLPMLQRRYARHLLCPSNALPEVCAQVREEGGWVAARPAGAGIYDGLTRLQL
jgi:hydroxymethylpyrimidine pyrophosphatase-like HAD family hydrolase